ncbi:MULTISPECIES: helix-turn-helix transcriptional regulator [Microbacteriaceae]|uniref:helix-turn-helix transcriptional regulator n=1 Tax=Microbacteriaceae TaxID=85023 RepID=UPI000B35D38D
MQTTARYQTGLVRVDSLAWTADDARRLGSSIKRLREARGLTQEQVAYTAGLTRAHYALIETGQSSSRRAGTHANPKLSTVAAIAAVLDIPMTELYDFGAEPHSQAAQTARTILDPGPHPIEGGSPSR